MIEDLRNLQLLEFAAGETIFGAGEYGKHAFLIHSGSIKLYKMRNGKEEVIAYMEPGQVLGEMAIITGAPRSATAQAAEPSQVLVIDRDTLQAIIKKSRPLVQALLNQFITRIQKTDEKLMQQKQQLMELEQALSRIQELARVAPGELPDNEDEHRLHAISEQCAAILGRI